MITSKNSVVFWIVGVVAVIAGLLIWSGANDPYKELKKKWQDAGVHCVQEGTQLAQHIHPHISVFVDGVQENIPPDTGIVQGCTAEVHTHEGNGVIHVESPRANEKFTLGQFFVVWGKPITREGFTMILGAGNVTVPEFSGYLEAENFYNSIELKDEQEIKIEYTTKK